MTKFDKELAPFLAAATEVKQRSSGRRVTTPSKRNYSAVREWAKSQGLEVSERGRVPKRIVEQYDASN